MQSTRHTSESEVPLAESFHNVTFAHSCGSDLQQNCKGDVWQERSMGGLLSAKPQATWIPLKPQPHAWWGERQGPVTALGGGVNSSLPPTVVWREIFLLFSFHFRPCARTMSSETKIHTSYKCKRWAEENLEALLSAYRHRAGSTVVDITPCRHNKKPGGMNCNWAN